MLYKFLKKTFINSFMNNAINVRIFSFLLLLLIWEIAALLINSDVMPSPKTVLIIFYDEMIYGEMLYHLGVTLWRVI